MTPSARGPRGPAPPPLGVLRGGIPGQPRHPPVVALEHLLRRALVAPDEAVYVDDAVEVIGLVLEAAGEESAALDLNRLAVDVHARDARPFRAAGREVF